MLLKRREKKIKCIAYEKNCTKIKDNKKKI